MNFAIPGKGRFMKKQGKLDILIDNFRRLDESRKDYIRDLTRKLADIHCGGEPGKEQKNSDLTLEKAF
jgi:hypothetical protein